jgi:hypothetical protein
MSDIFISYAHEDRPMAEALARAFEAEQLSVWWDTDIRAGKYFDEVIERELACSRLTVVLWSQQSVRSRWVRDEAQEALSLGKLVPVFIEKDVVLPLTFKRLQAADLSGWDRSSDGADFQVLLTEIRLRVGPAPSPPPPPAAEQPPPKARAAGSPCTDA